LKISIGVILTWGVILSTFPLQRLVADTEFNLESELKRQNVKSARSIETPTSKLEQIAVLEASLPENTLQKLSLGELDNIMLQQGKHFVAKGSDLSNK
jgi:hypothetical protein